MSRYALSFVALAGALPAVFAHIGIWHPSMYGFNASGYGEEHYYDAPVNTDFTRNPLRLDMGLTFDQWWFHGLRGAKPNAIMELPVGERIMIEHSCNKAFTSYGIVPEQIDLVGDFPCMINLGPDGRPRYGDPNVQADNGPLHVADITDTKGCGLTIAYTNDVYSVTPETFTVFSVNHTCVWNRKVEFEIPQDLPPCPNGKCICAWNWIHGAERGEGYGNELYMVGFDCNVVNSKSTATLKKPKTPTLCDTDSSKCVKGAKQGLYWQGAQSDGWNIPWDQNTRNPPFYNQDWGFADGAQNDIFDYPEVQTTASSSTTSEAVKETPRVKVLAASSTRKADTASPVRTTSREELQEPLNRVAIVTETVTATSTVVVVVTATAEASEHESDSDKRKRSSVERARGPAHHKRRLDGAGLRWTHKLGRRSS